MPLTVEDLERFRDDISTCPHPWKLRFENKRDAMDHAVDLGLKVYKCVCGDWHMTGQCSEYVDPECPICGAPIDDWGPGCGCFEELHYGD